MANALYPADERRDRRLDGEHPVGYVDAIDGIWPREKYGLWGEKIEEKQDGGEVEDIARKMYRSDLDRVISGQSPIYYKQLDDKPLDDTHPEFDILTGGVPLKSAPSYKMGIVGKGNVFDNPWESSIYGRIFDKLDDYASIPNDVFTKYLGKTLRGIKKRIPDKDDKKRFQDLAEKVVNRIHEDLDYYIGLGSTVLVDDKEKKQHGGYIASRDNTSVGNHGINENLNLNNRVNHEYLDITDVIAGFVPVVSDIQDINDFKEGIVNKDPLAVTLSAFGLLPFVGGLFTSANKMRKIRASYKDMLRLYDEPDVKAYFKEAYRGRNDKEIKSILKEMSKDEDRVDELYKRILQGRYQFYRGDADISNHNISQIAPYQTKPVDNGIGSGRHNAEDLKDSGLGVLYTTNDINKASKFASTRQRGKGWVPSENGGMGIIRIKDADFSGSRYDWIRNNPIPDNIVGDFRIRKVDNNDGTSDYIFIGEPNKSVGAVKYFNSEKVRDEANKQFRSTPDGQVAMWKEGGSIDVDNEYGAGKYVVDPRRSEDSKMAVYDEIWGYLTEKKGIPQTQAIGILSNIAAESGGDTEALGVSGDFGIQQWLGPRKKELQRRYGKKPTLTQQLDYLVDEYQGRVPGLGWNYMNQGKFFDKDAQGNIYNYYMYSKADFDNATNYKDATVAWNQGYGRPLGSTLRNEKRFEFADMFSNRYGVPENEPMRYEFGQRDSSTGDGGQQPVPETVAPAAPSLASHPAMDSWWEKEGQDLLYKMLAQSGANKKAIEDIANNIKNDPQSEAQIAEAERMHKEQAKRQLVLNMIPGLSLNIKGMSRSQN